MGESFVIWSFLEPLLIIVCKRCFHSPKGQTGTGSRIKSLHTALDELLHCQDTVTALNRNTTEEAGKKDTEKSHKTKTERKASKVVDDRTSPLKVLTKMEQKREVESLKVCNQNSGMTLDERESSHLSPSMCNPKGDNEFGELMPQGQSAKVKGQEAVQLQTRHYEDASRSVYARKTVMKVTSSPSIDEDSVDEQTKMSYEKDEKQKQQVKVIEDISGQRGSETSSTTGDTSHKSQSMESDEKTSVSREAEERNRLLGILKSRLQFVLLNLIKLHGGTKKG